jgi:hypothetical protein
MARPRRSLPNADRVEYQDERVVERRLAIAVVGPRLIAERRIDRSTKCAITRDVAADLAARLRQLIRAR